MINILMIYSELYKPYDLMDTVLKVNIKRLHTVPLRASRDKNKLENDERYVFKSKQKSPITLLEDPEYEDEYIWVEREDIIQSEGSKPVYNIIYVDNIDLKIDIENLAEENPDEYNIQVINILPKPYGLFINSTYSVLMMAKCKAEVLVKLEERTISAMKAYYVNLHKMLHTIMNLSIRNINTNNRFVIVSCIDSAADVKTLSKNVKAILDENVRITPVTKKVLGAYLSEIDDFYYGLGLGYKIKPRKEKGKKE